MYVRFETLHSGNCEEYYLLGCDAYDLVEDH
jgi:hypothetical protein